MGGGSLFWKLLNNCCVTHDSPQAVADVLRRQKLAIDLSIWVLQCDKGATQAATDEVGAEDIHLGILLYRTLRLCSTKHGAPQLAFVGDPPTSNKVFNQKCRHTMEMLQLMGFPCIFAEGEAEGLCAQLNRSGIVDACVTPDGDSLCFGARRVLRTLALGGDRKVEIVSVEAAEVKRCLGLRREDLVGCMLLLGCDFTEGVMQIGASKTLKIMQQLTAAGLQPMKVLQDWIKGGDGGVIWDPHPKDRGASRPTHCGQCGLAICEYRGMKKKACKPNPKGASQTPNTASVSSPDSDLETEEETIDAEVGGGLCECSWCVSMAAFRKQDFLRRARIRVSGAHAPTAAKVMELYLRDLTSAEESRYLSQLKWTKPNVSGLCDLFTSKLGWSNRGKAEIKLLPLSTRWYFSSQPEFCDYVPLQIVKRFRTADRILFKVLWRRKGDKLLESASSTQACASPVVVQQDADSDANTNVLETDEGAEFVEGCDTISALLAEFYARTVKPSKPGNSGKKRNHSEVAMRGLQDIRTLFQKVGDEEKAETSGNKNSHCGLAMRGLQDIRTFFQKRKFLISSTDGLSVDGPSGGKPNPRTASAARGRVAKQKLKKAGKGKEKKTGVGTKNGSARLSTPRSIAASSCWKDFVDRHRQPDQGSASKAGPNPKEEMASLQLSQAAFSHAASHSDRNPCRCPLRPTDARFDRNEPVQTPAPRSHFVIDLSKSLSGAEKVPLSSTSMSIAEQ